MVDKLNLDLGPRTGGNDLGGQSLGKFVGNRCRMGGQADGHGGLISVNGDLFQLAHRINGPSCFGIRMGSDRLTNRISRERGHDRFQGYENEIF